MKCKLAKYSDEVIYIPDGSCVTIKHTDSNGVERVLSGTIQNGNLHNYSKEEKECSLNIALINVSVEGDD